MLVVDGSESGCVAAGATSAEPAPSRSPGVRGGANRAPILVGRGNGVNVALVSGLGGYSFSFMEPRAGQIGGRAAGLYPARSVLDRREHGRRPTTSAPGRRFGALICDVAPRTMTCAFHLAGALTPSETPTVDPFTLRLA